MIIYFNEPQFNPGQNGMINSIDTRNDIDIIIILIKHLNNKNLSEE